MTLPTEADFDGCLDGQNALKHFLGRTPAEAQALFLQNPWTHFEDLDYMGPVAFRFYVPAAIRALLGGSASFEWGFPLASFASTLERWLFSWPEEVRPIAPQLADACEEFLSRWSSFETMGYDELPERFGALRDLLREHAA